MLESAKYFFSLSNILSHHPHLSPISIIHSPFRCWKSLSRATDCSVLECVGDGNTLGLLWSSSSSSHSCSISIMNPVLHKDGSAPPTAAPFYLLLIPLGSIGSSSLSWISNLLPYFWNLYFYPRPFLHVANIFVHCGGVGWGWRDVIAFIPHRLESRLHQKTENCCMQRPRNKYLSLSQH